MNTDNEIIESLQTLITASREQSEKLTEIFCDSEVQDRIVELYDENGIVASLVNQVILNKEVAHSFCTTLGSVRELWDKEDVQIAFAQALRNGDTLLIDAIFYIKQYRDVPEIQKAIAHNIASCSSMLFQINVVSGIGLVNQPSIKQAILERKRDIIDNIRNNWHEGVCLTRTPYLIHDEDVRQVLSDARPAMIQNIIEGVSLVDISFLMKELEWLRHDIKIVEAVRHRISNTSAEFDYVFMKTLRECGMFQKYPELMDALSLHGENTKAMILGT